MAPSLSVLKLDAAAVSSDGEEWANLIRGALLILGISNPLCLAKQRVKQLGATRPASKVGAKKGVGAAAWINLRDDMHAILAIILSADAVIRDIRCGNCCPSRLKLFVSI